MLELYTGSIEYVGVNVSSRESLSSTQAHIGFSTDADTPATVWTAAAWTSMQPTVEDMGDTYARAVMARVLVGAVVAGGAVTLTVGSYWAWVKITTASEMVIKRAGQVEVL